MDRKTMAENLIATYTEKYTKKHGITVEEAKKAIAVINYEQYVKELQYGKI